MLLSTSCPSLSVFVPVPIKFLTLQVYTSNTSSFIHLFIQDKILFAVERSHDLLPSRKSQWNMRDKFKYLRYPVVKGKDRCVHIGTELHKKKEVSSMDRGGAGMREHSTERDWWTQKFFICPQKVG